MSMLFVRARIHELQVPGTLLKSGINDDCRNSCGRHLILLLRLLGVAGLARGTQAARLVGEVTPTRSAVLRLAWRAGAVLGGNQVLGLLSESGDSLCHTYRHV